MTDREKVILALELCRYDPDPGQEKKWYHSCLKCPYCTDRNGMEMNCAQMYTDAIALLREQEPEIVRCKDCKHYDQDTQSCNNGLDGIFLPDWFCADGERRDDDA